jgi:hypothetical protein
MRDFLAFAVIIVAIVFTPFIGIWAVNTLFGLGILYTFKTWLAALILGAIISPTVQVKKN